MGDGPPGFKQGFSGPALLRYPLRVRLVFVYVAITLFDGSFQTASTNQRIGNSTVADPTTPGTARGTQSTDFADCSDCHPERSEGSAFCFSFCVICGLYSPCSAGFGLFRFRSPLLSESRLFSLPPGTEMVHFPGFAFPAYEFSGELPVFNRQGFPIRTSPDQCLLAAPRGLSQLATSFIAYLRQGIHRTPLVA